MISSCKYKLRISVRITSDFLTKNKLNIDFIHYFDIAFFRPLKADDHRQNDDVEDFERSLGLLSDYADAERHGKYTGQCGKRYGMCPFSIHSILPKVNFMINSFMLILL